MPEEKAHRPARTALVTGSTRGIGRVIAGKLAQRGMHVIVSGRDRSRGQRVATEIRSAGGKADFVASELSDAAGARALATAAGEITGSVDVLVNNAAVYPWVATTATSEEDFDSVYAVNVKAPLFLVAELAPQMAERGQGVIVNVTTAGAASGLVGATAYISSKAALNSLTRIWAKEFGPAGVRVNTISLGAINYGQFDLAESHVEAVLASVPSGRFGLPGEVAEGIAFLTSDAASYVNGAYFSVDGGLGAG